MTRRQVTIAVVVALILGIVWWHQWVTLTDQRDQAREDICTLMGITSPPDHPAPGSLAAYNLGTFNYVANRYSRYC
jgi:hypothetical protein